MSDVAPARRLSFGGVVRTGFGLLRRNALTFGVLAFLLGYLPTFGFGILRVTGLVPDPGTDALAAMRGAPGEAIVVGLLGVLLQGALIYGCLASARGDSSGLGDGLGAARRNFLRLLGLAILMNLAVLVGLLLFVIPGFLLLARWLVAPAVLLQERKVGVMEAMGRSAELARNNYWVLLGLILSATIAAVGILFAIGAVVGLATEGSFLGLALQNLLLDPLGTAVFALLGGVGCSAVYVELQGVGSGEDVAQVFG